MTSFLIAIQMRYLQALADLASDQNSTIIFPLPLELMRAFMKTEQVAGDPVPQGNSQPKNAAEEEGNRPLNGPAAGRG
jgi:hypothetical protein